MQADSEIRLNVQPPKHKKEIITMVAIALTRDLYFVTSTVIDWLDVFTRPLYKKIVIESLEYCQKEKGLDIYAWVLMTNHLHMKVGTRDTVPL